MQGISVGSVEAHTGLEEICVIVYNGIYINHQQTVCVEHN